MENVFEQTFDSIETNGRFELNEYSFYFDDTSRANWKRYDLTNNTMYFIKGAPRYEFLEGEEKEKAQKCLEDKKGIYSISKE
jgi:hypothetical protein